MGFKAYLLWSHLIVSRFFFFCCRVTATTTKTTAVATAAKSTAAAAVAHCHFWTIAPCNCLLCIILHSLPPSLLLSRSLLPCLSKRIPRSLLLQECAIFSNGRRFSHYLCSQITLVSFSVSVSSAHTERIQQWHTNNISIKGMRIVILKNRHKRNTGERKKQHKQITIACFWIVIPMPLFRSRDKGDAFKRTHKKIHWDTYLLNCCLCWTSTAPFEAENCVVDDWLCSVQCARQRSRREWRRTRDLNDCRHRTMSPFRPIRVNRSIYSLNWIYRLICTMENSHSLLLSFSLSLYPFPSLPMRYSIDE